MPRHLPLLLLAGCAGWDVSEEDGLRVLRRDVGYGSAARADLVVDVEDGETAMLATVVLDEGVDGYVDRLVSPEGDDVFVASDWWDSGSNKTNAAYASSVVTLNWPVSADDTPLTPGRWRVITRSDAGAGRASASVSLKSDADLDQGALVVEVHVADDVAADEGLSDGIDAAIARWRTVVYDPADLALDVRRVPWSGAPTELAAPGFGDAEAYRAVVGDKPLRVVPVLVVRWISEGELVFGVSGGIPGPLVGTDRSAVTISAAESAGADLVFSDAEIRLLSETMAHEVGHYLGLFHPVEIPRTGDRPTAWDALDDTARCTPFSRDCVGSLADNLMFPTPVCEDFDCVSLVSQTELTPDQVGVVQRYVGVR